jgi:hypothetical protein
MVNEPHHGYVEVLPLLHGFNYNAGCVNLGPRLSISSARPQQSTFRLSPLARAIRPLDVIHPYANNA